MFFLQVDYDIDIVSNARAAVERGGESADDHIGRADSFQRVQNVQKEAKIGGAFVRHAIFPPII
jgi:hypothetical protein